MTAWKVTYRSGRSARQREADELGIDREGVDWDCGTDEVTVRVDTIDEACQRVQAREIANALAAAGLGPVHVVRSELVITSEQIR